MNGSSPIAHTGVREKVRDFSTPLLFSSSREELQRFFFKPIQFYFQLADLAVKLLYELLLLFILLFSQVSEKIRKGFKKLLFPSAYLIAMYPVEAGQFCQRLLLLDRFQSHFGPKCRIITFSHVDHFTIPPFLSYGRSLLHLIPLSIFWGVVQRPIKNF